MNARVFFLVLIIQVILLFFTGCSKKENTTIDNSVQSYSQNQGLGSNKGYPSGKQFVLPSYIKIISAIHGGPFVYKEGGKIDKLSLLGHLPEINIKDGWTTYGCGSIVWNYMKIYNSSSEDVILKFPAGLIFVDSVQPEDTIGDYQSGLVLQDVYIPIGANDTVFACVNNYCLNIHLLPSCHSAIYKLGPVTDNIELCKIIDILRTKKSPCFNNIQPEIQEIIWKITDYDLVLNDRQIDYLKSLP